MGRTNPTYRTTLDSLENDGWKDFRRTLRQSNQPVYDDHWEKARRHADAANAANPRPMDGALFSIALAQQREINALQEELEALRDEIGVIAGRVESLEHEPEVSRPLERAERIDPETQAKFEADASDVMDSR